jgi:hypothetical protein
MEMLVGMARAQSAGCAPGSRVRRERMVNDREERNQDKNSHKIGEKEKRRI